MRSLLNPRSKAWGLAAVSILLAGALVAWLLWRREARTYDAARLLQSLPLEGAVKVYIDADALRSSGVLDSLAGSRASEEADYKRFVEQTGFDYRRDLNAVAGAFTHGDVYFVVRGRFDWKRLEDYARAQQGQCLKHVCAMPASQPHRNISFYPLADNVLALAVAESIRAVEAVSPSAQRPAPPAPTAPVWVSSPGSAFRDLRGLPAGGSILSPLAEAREAAFGIRAVSGESFEVRMDAAFPSSEAAQKAVFQFTTTTDLLRKMLQRQKLSPNPGDLSGPLSGGAFEAKGAGVAGTWPIQKQFIEALLGDGK